MFYRRKKKERSCSIQLLPDTPWPDCRGTETTGITRSYFTRYKRDTHITVHIKIIWALSVSKSQWKDSGLNTASNKGNAWPSSYNTMLLPHSRAWHPFQPLVLHILHMQMVTAPQGGTAPGDCSSHHEQSLHCSPLLLTTDFKDTFHLFPRQSRSQKDEAKFKQINSNVMLKQLIIDRDLVTPQAVIVTVLLLFIVIVLQQK